MFGRNFVSHSSRPGRIRGSTLAVASCNAAASRGALFNSDSLMNGSAATLKVISRTDQVAGNIVPIYGSIKTGAVRKKNERKERHRSADNVQAVPSAAPAAGRDASEVAALSNHSY